MNIFKLLVWVLFANSSFATTLFYDDAVFPAGSQGRSSIVEQGFSTTGSFTHSGTQDSTRSSNESTGFLSVVHNEHVTVRSTSGALFDVFSVDLAEYSTVFRHPAKVEFYATLANGSIVSTIFVTDGLFDGPGGIADFETFAFPSDFRNVQSFQTKTINIFQSDHPFSMDNLRVSAVPEPATSIALLSGLVSLAVHCRCRKMSPSRTSKVEH